MANRNGTARIVATWIAAAMLSMAQGCSGGGDDDGGPAGTCNPTPQTTANPTGAAQFCTAFYGALCDRGFTDCVTQLGIAPYFSSAAECRAEMTFDCDETTSTTWLDAACGASCLALVQHGSCAVFESPTEPAACAAAVGEFAPACTATISPGTITDTITSADPMLDGGYAHTYCISLLGGRTVTITTAAPTNGGYAIRDTVLYLYGPNGARLATNDDSSGLYSLVSLTVPATGEYRIVVRGYSAGHVGSYDLTVAVSP